MSGSRNARCIVATMLPGVLVSLLLSVPPRAVAAASSQETRVIGTSLRGRDIVARRYGDGPKIVLVVGQIHGNEKSGVSLARHIARRGARPGFTLWLIETVNPDGAVRNTRQNAAGVDLNRNFPARWKSQTCPGKYCSGPRAGSEPETRALMDFLAEVRPSLVVFYHSAGNVVDAARTGVGNASAVSAYARASGLRSTEVSCGPGGCTGNATQFVHRRDPRATAFVVELPCHAGCLGGQALGRHTDAFWAAARAA